MLSTIRRASRLRDFGLPVAVSKTATPTGEVSISVSRSALTRRSSRCLRTLAMTTAAWEENMARASSSSWLNLSTSLSWPRKMTPTHWPPCLIGADRPAHTVMGRDPSNPRDDTYWP